MFSNYLKIALRNLFKRKMYSSINILGLAFGMACVLLIVVYLEDELSYDRFHENAEDIYRVTWLSSNPQTRTPHPMAQAMVRDFPQVEAATSLSPLWGAGLTRQTLSIKNPERNIIYDERDILSADSTFFDVFSFELLKGNKQKVLRDIGGILLSESMAHKYFGDEDPIGKPLAINDDRTSLMVEGVFADVPDHSHFHFDALISYVTLKAIEGPGSEYYSWADFGHYNYVKLREGSDHVKLESMLLDWSMKYLDLNDEDQKAVLNSNDQFGLQPITDIHLKSKLRWELEPNGNIDYVYIMSAAAFFILAIACINFMNLTTARSTERAREVGIRKSLGAYRSQIGNQFLGESLLTATLAILIAGLLAEICLPLFNMITNKNLNINYLDNPELILILVGGTVITGLVAAIYPSLFLASMNPIGSLKGIVKTKPGGIGFRKSLIVFQFVISMMLLTGSLVIYHQLKFIHNKDLGFDKNGLLVIPLKNYALLDKTEAMTTELASVNGVQSVAFSSNMPGRQFNQNPIASVQNPERRTNASEVYVSYDFFETLDIKFESGRPFSRDYLADSNSLVINQSAALALGLKEPLGKEILWYNDNDDGQPLKGTVIGVVEDFNYGSLHEVVQPLIFYRANAYNNIVLRMNSDNPEKTIAQIAEVWKLFENRFEFEYSLLTDDLEQLYRSEQKTASVFSGFSVIAILIACFGLYGIASLSYAQRTKEVGIRKVLGASVFSILTTLIRDFSILIVIAIIIAAPLAWWLMNSWLENFTYRIEVSLLDVGVSAVALIMVALVTISYLTLKTAYSNPVDSLKEE